MKKTSKEYAEKLAKDYVSDFTNPVYKEHGYAKDDFISGYLKAVEETKAEELIDVLADILIKRVNVQMKDSFATSDLRRAFARATNLIKSLKA